MCVSSGMRPLWMLCVLAAITYTASAAQHSYKMCPGKVPSVSAVKGPDDVMSKSQCAHACNALSSGCKGYSFLPSGSGDGGQCKLFAQSSREPSVKLEDATDPAEQYYEKRESGEHNSDMDRAWCTPIAEDCDSLFDLGYRQDGVYLISPPTWDKSFSVYCDMTAGGWTVIQRKLTNDVDFEKTWAEYKDGFGDLYGDHWLGNDKLHYLTSASRHQLRTTIYRYNADPAHTHYDNFAVGDVTSSFLLTVDSLRADLTTSGMYASLTAYHNGQKFSTSDMDNDKSTNNCANQYLVGWWFNVCHKLNPNAVICASTPIASTCQGKFITGITGIVYENTNGYMIQIKKF